MFEYGPEELNTDHHIKSSVSVGSTFDTTLCRLWDQKMAEGVFRYNLDDVKRKTLPGRFGIQVQLNEKRFTQRRKPETESTQVVMPFDADKFNFTKIKEAEVLMRLKWSGDNGGAEMVEQIVINMAPIEYGHSLILPRCLDCLPQVMTRDAVVVAIHTCLMSLRPGFVAGFNGLRALASVNHLHIQTMYIEGELPIALACVQHVHKELFVLHEYMVNGFVLQLADVKDVETLSSNVVKITDFLCANNIPLNMVMSMRKLLQSTSIHDDGPTDKTYVTVFIIPKLPSPGVTDDAFNNAFLEVAGYIPLKDRVDYDGMCETDVLRVLAKYTLGELEFDRLREMVVNLLD